MLSEVKCGDQLTSITGLWIISLTKASLEKGPGSCEDFMGKRWWRASGEEVEEEAAGPLCGQGQLPWWEVKAGGERMWFILSGLLPGVKCNQRKIQNKKEWTEDNGVASQCRNCPATAHSTVWIQRGLAQGRGAALIVQCLKGLSHSIPAPCN